MSIASVTENLLSNVAEPFRGLRYVGPAEALALLFTLVVTAILFISRVQRCRKGDGAYSLRDVTALLLGPVIGGMLFLYNAAFAAASYGVLDLDSDYQLRFGMQGAASCVWIALCCFVVAVVGILWPISHDTSEGSSGSAKEW